MNRGPTTVKPAAGWYALALACGVAGLVAAILVVQSGRATYRRAIDGFERVPVGSSGVLEFAHPGTYTLFSELNSPDPGDGYGVNIEIRSVRSGAEIRTRVLDVSRTYHSQGRSGFGLGTVEIPAAGRYEVTTTRVRLPETVVGSIAFGGRPMPRANATRPQALGLVALGLVAAAIVAVVGCRRRSTALTEPGEASVLGPAGRA